MNEKILFVDDDPSVLAAYKREFRKDFVLDVASNGIEGLEIMKREGPYYVVVADMRMPEMDGIEFLVKVKELMPDTVRIMLTGNAEQQTAIDAVNEGNIFRFLTKPCPPELFEKAIRAGIVQYELVVAERELLEKTLSGSIKVLTDVLSILNPEAFCRSSRLRGIVKQLATEMRLQNIWRYEIAAMLSLIGCVILPPDTLTKVYQNKQLSAGETDLYNSFPLVSSQLLANIPRLEIISKMISKQLEPYQALPLPEQNPDEYSILIGAQILKIAMDFDVLISRGLSIPSAISRLYSHAKEYNPDLLEVLACRPIKPKDTFQIMNVGLDELKTGMIVSNDILARNGMLLVPKGQIINFLMLARLKNISQGIGVIEPIEISVPVI